MRQLEPSKLRRAVGAKFFELSHDLGIEQGSTSYRMAQLLGQFWIPDSKGRVLAFQGYYAGLRVLDMAEEILTRLRDN